MLKVKRLVIPLVLITCMLFTTLNVFASGSISGSILRSNPDEPFHWVAPNGGTWTLVSTIGSPSWTPLKTTYITYNALCLQQASSLTRSDLMSLANIGRDQGLKYLLTKLAEKIGATAAAQWVPFLGNAVTAYDFLNGLASLLQDMVYEDAIRSGCGVSLSDGVLSNGQYLTNYCEKWYGPNVYNPAGCVGSFKGN